MTTLKLPTTVALTLQYNVDRNGLKNRSANHGCQCIQIECSQGKIHGSGKNFGVWSKPASHFLNGQRNAGAWPTRLVPWYEKLTRLEVHYNCSRELTRIQKHEVAVQCGYVSLMQEEERLIEQGSTIKCTSRASVEGMISMMNHIFNHYSRFYRAIAAHRGAMENGPWAGKKVFAD